MCLSFKHSIFLHFSAKKRPSYSRRSNSILETWKEKKRTLSTCFGRSVDKETTLCVPLKIHYCHKNNIWRAYF